MRYIRRRRWRSCLTPWIICAGGGSLWKPEPPYPKRRVVPRRNLRREELERRASLIRELTAFCEVVEGVVAGERIVDDETMADLITRARAYLATEESAIEQPTSESEPKPADTAGATPRRGGDTEGATPRRGGELEYSTTEDWQYTQRLIDKRTPYSETLSTPRRSGRARAHRGGGHRRVPRPVGAGSKTTRQPPKVLWVLREPSRLQFS